MTRPFGDPLVPLLLTVNYLVVLYCQDPDLGLFLLRGLLFGFSSAPGQFVYVVAEIDCFQILFSDDVLALL